jgi:pyruvate dehydrogenase E2 component (dihydrolipoamide acetyltransferase)
MAIPIIMPKVDMVMETGTFIEWLIKEGEQVEKGQPLFVISSDKAAIDVDSPASGILAGLSASPDDVIPISKIIGYILEPGEPFPLGEQHRRESGDTTTLRATPLARRLARDLKLDLRLISGSGPRGRIYRADVERALITLRTEETITANSRPLSTVPAHPSSDPAQTLSIPLPAAREKSRIAVKGYRKIIYQRVEYSYNTIPHIHISVQVDMTEASRMRQKVEAYYQQQMGFGLSYTAIIAHAVAHILNRHPFLNSSLLDQEIILWEDVHLGIATDLEENLVVPVIREAQTKKLDEIARDLHELVEKAHSRKLLPAEMSGSTFTLSNLGMMGAVTFTALINPPETAILAVGKIIEMAVVAAKEIKIRPMMVLNLAVDHRVIHGAQATRFLMDLKTVLENPYQLL